MDTSDSDTAIILEADGVCKSFAPHQVLTDVDLTGAGSYDAQTKEWIPE